MNPFSPARNFVMHQPVTALTVRILILLLLAVPLVLALPQGRRTCRTCKTERRRIRRPRRAAALRGRQCDRPALRLRLRAGRHTVRALHVLDVRRVGVRRRTAPAAACAPPRRPRRKDKPRQNRISLLLALVVAADLWRCHYNIVWWQNNQLEADYAANPLGLYVDALFVLFALLNLAAVTLPLWDVFVRGRRAESAMPSASRREPV